MTSPPERLITLLTEIRDNQLRQVANFERAMEAQEQAKAVQRFGGRLLAVAIIAPWLLAAGLITLRLLENSLW